MRGQAEGPPGLGGGALLAQRAGAAGGAEGDMAARGDRAGDAGRAGHRAVLLVDGEVIASESSGHGGLHRLGLDHRLVPGVLDRTPQVPGPIRRVAVPGKLVTVTVAVARGIRADRKLTPHGGRVSRPRQRGCEG